MPMPTMAIQSMSTLLCNQQALSSRKWTPTHADANYGYTVNVHVALQPTSFVEQEMDTNTCRCQLWLYSQCPRCFATNKLCRAGNGHQHMPMPTMAIQSMSTLLCNQQALS